MAVSVGLAGAFKKILLYVMISNLDSMYMRIISLTYQVIGALSPKLTAHKDFMP